MTPYAGVLPGKFYPSSKSHLWSGWNHRLADWPEAYTSSVNVLDYASVVIPVTLADKKLDIVSLNFSGLNEEDRMNMNYCRSPFPAPRKAWLIYNR